MLSAASAEESRRLTDLARLTVGLGTALFTFRSSWKRLGRRPALILACLLGFGAMRAEDAVVNRLADRATAQERLEAKAILLFNSALNKNLVVLPDMARDMAADPVKLKAFSKVLGLAVWNDAALVAEIRAKTASVWSALYGPELYERIDAGYDQYAETWSRNIARMREAEQKLSRLNFAAYARQLNGQLPQYANCAHDDCRRAISRRINDYLAKNLPDLPFALDMEAFCGFKAGTRYVMGRAVAGEPERVCGAGEQALRAYVLRRADETKMAALEGLDAPENIKRRLLSETRLSLAEWRGLWQGRADEDLEKKKEAEFGRPERYGQGGEMAEEGRDYAVSVFLPPVALGFSITVCFLHLASLAAALTKRPRVCAAAAALIYLEPYIFAARPPLSGFAGLYAGWLIHWESLLYPLGLLRNLIL